MSAQRAPVIRFAAFAAAMVMLTACLFFIFGQYRTTSGNGYSAVFTSASRLKAGDTVRVAGVRVGTVQDVSLRTDNTVVVAFDADRTIRLTPTTKAAIRYLNLVGDRYLELIDEPGASAWLAPGTQIPVERTAPALEIDALLGGLKPVLQGLRAQDVNALTSSLIQIFQGQGPTLSSLFAKTSSFSNDLADNSVVIEQLIDNLNTVMATLSTDGDKFASTVDGLQQLVTRLADDRDPISSAITSLDQGTASLADLLGQSRSPLAGTVDQLNRLAPLLDGDKDSLDVALQHAPENARKLARIGAYGSFVQYYICGITVRVSDLQGRTAVFPWIKQEGGRCAEPHA